MEVLLYISAAIAALSLLLIAIFVIITLKSAKQTIGEVSETLKRVETKIGGITEKSNELMDKTNRIADDAESKIQSFNQLTNSAKSLEKSTEYIQQSIKQMSNKVANPPKKYTNALQQASTLTEVISRVYYGFIRKKERGE